MLWQRFPIAKWYLMIDDDSYLLLENIMSLLAGYDPEQPWYLGNPMYFIGCDGIREMGKSIRFAHGGSVGSLILL
jgi:hypothetical protein